MLGNEQGARSFPSADSASCRIKSRLESPSTRSMHTRSCCLWCCAHAKGPTELPDIHRIAANVRHRRERERPIQSRCVVVEFAVEAACLSESWTNNHLVLETRSLCRASVHFDLPFVDCDAMSLQFQKTMKSERRTSPTSLRPGGASSVNCMILLTSPHTSLPFALLTHTVSFNTLLSSCQGASPPLSRSFRSLVVRLLA